MKTQISNAEIASGSFRRLYKGVVLPNSRPFIGLRLKGHAQHEAICDCCTDEGCGGDDCNACVIRQKYE